MNLSNKNNFEKFMTKKLIMAQESKVLHSMNRFGWDNQKILFLKCVSTSINELEGITETTSKWNTLYARIECNSIKFNSVKFCIYLKITLSRNICILHIFRIIGPIWCLFQSFGPSGDLLWPQTGLNIYIFFNLNKKFWTISY